MLVDNNFDAEFSIKTLTRISWEHARAKSHRGADGVSPQQYDRGALYDLSQARDRIEEKRFKFTRLKRIYKPKHDSPRSREVQIPTVRDRVVLTALKNYLESKGLPKGPGLPTSVTSEIYRRVRKSGSVLKAFARTDISNFFPSINHQHLLMVLDSMKLDYRAVYLVARALELSDGDGVGVPQGISISTCLTEFYLNSILAPVFKEIRKDGSEVFRYVDDFLILSPSKSDAKRHVSAVKSLLGLHGLSIYSFSHSGSGKSELGWLSDGFLFLGYNFDCNGASVPKRRVATVLDRVSSTLHAYMREFSEPGKRDHAAARANWYMRIAMNGCVWRGRRRGWLPYYLGTNDLQAFALVTRHSRRMIEKHGLGDVIEAPSMVEGYFSYRRKRADRILDLDVLSVDDRKTWLIEVCSISRSFVDTYSESEINAEFDAQVGARLDSLEVDLSLQVY